MSAHRNIAEPFAICARNGAFIGNCSFKIFGTGNFNADFNAVAFRNLSLIDPILFRQFFPVNCHRFNLKFFRGRRLGSGFFLLPNRNPGFADGLVCSFILDCNCATGDGNRFAVEERDLCNHFICALIFQQRFQRFTCLSVRMFFIVDEPFISGHIFQIFRALQFPAVLARSAVAGAAVLFNFDFAGVLRKETFSDLFESALDLIVNLILLVCLQEKAIRLMLCPFFVQAVDKILRRSLINTENVNRPLGLNILQPIRNIIIPACYLCRVFALFKVPFSCVQIKFIWRTIGTDAFR